jgi:DNA topoisomerase-3
MHAVKSIGSLLLLVTVTAALRATVRRLGQSCGCSSCSGPILRGAWRSPNHLACPQNAAATQVAGVLMRLIIAEKPSLARAIADVLASPQQRKGDYIECGGGDVVAWCAGHILEMAEPEDYDPAYSTWRLEDLPMSPQDWKLNASAPGLVKTLKGLLAEATSVVHAGDPDREGQLLVDEVLHHLNYRGPVQRVLINDLSPGAVRKALAALQPNATFRPLYEAALGRQRADWLYGMNMSRLYTLLADAGGFDGVLSVGRVQTPVLGLVVRRDLAIEGFTAKPYWVVEAEVESALGGFTATWIPGAQAEGALDEEGRLVDRSKAEAVQARVQGQPGAVTKSSSVRKAEPPPLPYSLADLQIDAGKRLGFTAARVLELSQALYETHQLTTYPRSDCSYLPEGQLAEAPVVLQAVAAALPQLGSLVAKADLGLRSRAWNDQKISAHHAIIPTSRRSAATLNDDERALFDLIARRYVAQFFPAHEFKQLELELELAGEKFRATGRAPIAPGWKEVLRTVSEESEEGSSETAAAAPVPPLELGARVTATSVKVADRKTQPPKAFTDASLMQAMVQVSRYVESPKVKELLRELDGIGTPATRASFIEALLKRKFLKREGKQLRSTATGRSLIAALPVSASTPDMTALWELALRRVHDRQMTLEDFLRGVNGQIRELVARGRAQGALKIAGAFPCAKPGCTGSMRQLKGSKGAFWSCRVCRSTAEDANGQPKSGGGAKRKTGRARRARKPSSSTAVPPEAHKE